MSTKQERVFNIKDSDKYKTLVVKPIFDSSCYNILIDDVVRYAGVGFSNQEVKEKLEFLKTQMVLEEVETEPSKVIRKKIEKEPRPIGRRGRPKGSKNKTHIIKHERTPFKW